MAMYRVRTRLQGWTGGPGLATFYFDDTAGGGAANALTVANRVRSAWDVIKTSFPTTWICLVQGQVDRIDEATGDLVGSFSVTAPATVVGTAATTFFGPAPTMGGLVLDTGTIVDSRRLKGHSNIGPVAASFTNFETPPGSLINNINAFGTALIGATPPLATAPMVVWRRPLKSGGTIVRAGLFRTVLGATASPEWFVLRSRRD